MNWHAHKVVTAVLSLGVVGAVSASAQHKHDAEAAPPDKHTVEETSSFHQRALRTRAASYIERMDRYAEEKRQRASLVEVEQETFDFYDRALKTRVGDYANRLQEK